MGCQLLMVLANGAPAYLQYIADLECNARLGAGYKLIIQRIIIELCTNKNLRTKTMKEEERERENLLVADTAVKGSPNACVCVTHQVCICRTGTSETHLIVTGTA